MSAGKAEFTCKIHFLLFFMALRAHFDAHIQHLPVNNNNADEDKQTAEFVQEDNTDMTAGSDWINPSLSPSRIAYIGKQILRRTPQEEGCFIIYSVTQS